MFLSTVNKVPFSLYPNQHSLSLVLLIIAILTMCGYISLWFLAYISLITSNVGYLLIYQLAICMSSFQNHLFRFCAHFVNQVCIYLCKWTFLVAPMVKNLCKYVCMHLFSCLNSFHVLDIKHLIRCIVCKYFLPFYRLSLHSVDVSFVVHKILVRCYPTCLFLFSMPVVLRSYPENHCPDQCQEAFPLYFLLAVLHFHIYVYVFNAV